MNERAKKTENNALASTCAKPNRRDPIPLDLCAANESAYWSDKTDVEFPQASISPLPRWLGSPTPLAERDPRVLMAAQGGRYETVDVLLSCIYGTVE